jgi:cellulose synthase/poly-beta-1,6-N-acetylglucosamine synthase-like glycosyltransferase
MTINNRRELWIARACTFATLISVTGVFYALLRHGHAAYVHHRTQALVETALFALVMFFVTYGNLLYQICLAGYYKRSDTHRPAPRSELEAIYDGEAPRLSFLVPSYKEEYDTNWQTLVSAALAEYPRKEVVLLIDDPRAPKAPEDMRMLEETRAIPARLQQLFDAPHARFVHELEAFHRRLEAGRTHAGVELNRLSLLYDIAADTLDAMGEDFIRGRAMAALSHVDRFYVEAIIGAQVRMHRERAQELRRQVHAGEVGMDEIQRQYRRLTGLFNVRFSSFERKKYVNLSHEANKAMNLNSYISLIGKSWKEVETEAGLELRECTPEEASFSVPAADFVNTIDADSMLLCDYALRLVHMMNERGGERIAVIQSPCSAYPGAGGGLERAAGAAIDLQYKTHQGYTHWNATFWVGANAMLRFAALQDIREVRSERGYDVSIFVQDRTVIEDTESSIDLVHKGWQLRNYPERMTFSSMPQDFGSLLIQRRRWANGGLLILPKLMSYVVHAPKSIALLKELFMRFHYLASTASGCLVALLFLFYPFSDHVGSIWVPLSAIPCFLLYLRDLRNSGYKTMDYLRICTLNLLLLPVVMGGVLKSLEQAITGKKIPFSRTPKIPGRTTAPALYSFIALTLPFFCFAAAALDNQQHHLGQAIVAFVDGILFLNALVFLLGVRETVQDIVLGVRGMLRSVGVADALLAPVRRLAFLVARPQRNA